MIYRQVLKAVLVEGAPTKRCLKLLKLNRRLTPIVHLRRHPGFRLHILDYLIFIFRHIAQLFGPITLVLISR